MQTQAITNLDTMPKDIFIHLIPFLENKEFCALYSISTSILNILESITTEDIKKLYGLRTQYLDLTSEISELSLGKLLLKDTGSYLAHFVVQGSTSLISSAVAGASSGAISSVMYYALAGGTGSMILPPAIGILGGSLISKIVPWGIQLGLNATFSNPIRVESSLVSSGYAAICGLIPAYMIHAQLKINPVLIKAIPYTEVFWPNFPNPYLVNNAIKSAILGGVSATLGNQLILRSGMDSIFRTHRSSSTFFSDQNKRCLKQVELYKLVEEMNAVRAKK